MWVPRRPRVSRRKWTSSWRTGTRARSRSPLTRSSICCSDSGSGGSARVRAPPPSAHPRRRGDRPRRHQLRHLGPVLGAGVDVAPAPRSPRRRARRRRRSPPRSARRRPAPPPSPAGAPAPRRSRAPPGPSGSSRCARPARRPAPAPRSRCRPAASRSRPPASAAERRQPHRRQQLARLEPVHIRGEVEALGRQPLARRPGPRTTSSAPSAARSGGKFEVGSPRQTLPPIVPRARTWRSTSPAHIRAVTGWRSRSSGSPPARRRRPRRRSRARRPRRARSAAAPRAG